MYLHYQSLIIFVQNHDLFAWNLYSESFQKVCYLEKISSFDLPKFKNHLSLFHQFYFH